MALQIHRAGGRASSRRTSPSTPRISCSASSSASARLSRRLVGAVDPVAPARRTAHGRTATADRPTCRRPSRLMWRCGSPVTPSKPSICDRAAQFIRAAGGVERTRVFTRIWLALFDLWPWADLPVLPPELIFLPSFVPLNIYDFGCWARQTVVALTVVGTHRPTHAVGSASTSSERPRASRRLSRSAPGRAGSRRSTAFSRPTSVVRSSSSDAPRSPGRALDSAASGGGRVLGRYPTAMGVLVDRPETAGLRPRAPRDEGRHRGSRRIYDRGRRREAYRGLPISGVGHRPRRHGPRRRRARRAATRCSAPRPDACCRGDLGQG